jgi:hypothetical protein
MSAYRGLAAALKLSIDDLVPTGNAHTAAA